MTQIARRLCFISDLLVISTLVPSLHGTILHQTISLWERRYLMNHGPILWLLSLLLISSTLAAQPINDDCEDAIDAILGANPFDITSATDSSIPADDYACTGELLGQFYRDLWWHFVFA